MDASFKRFEGSANKRTTTATQTAAERKERRKWTPIDDVVLISSWLNTSKYHVVGNEQKSGAFWKRITAYFAASPKVAGCEHREAAHCKKRWHKINDLVNKFFRAHEAASREKSSGQNDNDELRNDQKWCDLYTSKTDGSAKRRKLDDGAHSSNFHACSKTNTSEADQATTHPPGVKASKQKNKAAGKVMFEFQRMWDIKKEDLTVKERLSKMKLLDSLIAKQELAEYEEALKKKFINELFSD
ncbi:BnaC08g11740D [Brassica napus]|uniref:BnaC08g11740D protein n=2 Tax=Brassica TaxID=3705 RepID=A0A078F7C6_BRANA|nr:glutathione S-transferase T3-like [Brassica napus]CDY08944.1 BnaC08g11740D [Brassica napus]